MKLLKTLAAATLSVAALTSVANAACDAGETVVKFAHVTNTDKHPKGIAATLLAERVNEEMNGTMCMEVYPNSSLYDDDKVLEAMLNGDVQFAAPSLSKFEKFTKKFRVFDLPFVFDDIEAVDRFQTSEGGLALLDSMQRRGLQGLGYWHNGMKQMSANRPLLDPADAKGLKFRVQPSDVLVAQFDALGANPQPMAFKEVYGALQTKVIDGQENTWSNIYGQKFFEVQDGTTQTDHGIIDYLLVTSTDFWEGLPEDQRAQLRTIVDEVTTMRNTESTKVDLENRALIEKVGGEIRTLTPEQRKKWVDAMKPVWEEFKGDIGQDVIDAAVAANEAS